MAMLYGILPPAMAWAMHGKLHDDGDGENTLYRAKPALIGIVYSPVEYYLSKCYRISHFDTVNCRLTTN